MSSTPLPPPVTSQAIPFQELRDGSRQDQGNAFSNSNSDSSTDQALVSPIDLSKWMTVNDVFLLRRFDELNARVLLDMQNKVAQKGEELKQMDQDCVKGHSDTTNPKAVSGTMTGMNSTVTQEPNGRRAEILNELKELLKEYNSYILAFSELRSRHTAEDHTTWQLSKWLNKENSDATGSLDKGFVHFADLISLNPKEKWLRKVFRNLKVPGLPDVTGLNRTQLDALQDMIIITIGLGALLGPLWAFTTISSLSTRVGFMSGIISLFVVGLSFGIRGQPFQILVGTAAYATVLGVFLQTGTGSS